MSRTVARNEEWRNLPEAEQERILNQLRDSKAEKEEKKVAKVAHEHTANDIEQTCTRLNSEVCIDGLQYTLPHVLIIGQLEAMSFRSGCHVFYLISRGSITDNFMARSFATPQVKEALHAMFLHTPDEMALKVNAFVTTGLAGALRLSGQNKPTRTKSEIRNLVINGFCESMLNACEHLLISSPMQTDALRYIEAVRKRTCRQ